MATIMYEPLASVVAGTVNVLEIEPLLFEVAGLILKSVLPFIDCQDNCTVEPAGK